MYPTCEFTFLRRLRRKAGNTGTVEYPVLQDQRGTDSKAKGSLSISRSSVTNEKRRN